MISTLKWRSAQKHNFFNPLFILRLLISYRFLKLILAILAWASRANHVPLHVWGKNLGCIYQNQAKVTYLFESILWIFTNHYFHFVIAAAVGTNEVGKIVHKGRIKVLTDFFFRNGESSKLKENKRKHEKKKEWCELLGQNSLTARGRPRGEGRNKRKRETFWGL